MFGDFGESIRGVDGGDDGAEGSDSEEANRVEEAVGGEEEDDVVFGEVEVAEEGVGEFNGERFQLGERKRLVGIGVDECGFCGE